jgi:hypothetical protein
VPSSSTRPPESTTIRSARRTVEKRCEILVARGGRYAELFELQAAGYR